MLCCLGVAGLVVVYGLNLNPVLSRFTWNLCHLENNMISAERIFQYCCFTSEPPLIAERNKPNARWPSHGEVVMYNLQVNDNIIL